HRKNRMTGIAARVASMIGCLLAVTISLLLRVPGAPEHPRTFPYYCDGLRRSHVAPDFTGRWVRHEKPGETAFDLTLIQRGNTVTGSHCAITRGGRRVDCAEESTGREDRKRRPSILGTVKGRTATVRFESRYDERAGGTAQLIYRGNRIDWAIVGPT